MCMRVYVLVHALERAYVYMCLRARARVLIASWCDCPRAVTRVDSDGDMCISYALMCVRACVRVRAVTRMDSEAGTAS
jgi:predicted nucleic acid-binding Zn finger protein